MIDGETACGGTGLLVLAACAAARAGADLDAVVARVREARKALRIWFCLDTLEYLRRGGRVGKAQAWLGGTLKIKPILSLEYEIVPSSACAPPGARSSAWSPTRRSSTTAAPTAGSCSTSRRPSSHSG